MEFSITKDCRTKKVTFSGSFEERELLELDLSRLDRLTLNQVHQTAADNLLALELIYRREQERLQALAQDKEGGDHALETH